MSRRVEELFHAARALSASTRATFLKSACGNDDALRGQVEALLRADAEAGAFLASPTGAAKEALAAATVAAIEHAGSQIGHYKLLEQIGEGGMGTIWLAEQREPVKRRVALKIIKLGMDTRQVIARFEAERQALAMMDHPHIAKVFDAGTTEAGRPYFVMEYIRGIPILEYCDKERIDTRSRLELFTKVCQAIQHAHQKGIIHRDIKPSNVLVTLHDGVPVPKVIDFGIAKATNSELTAKTLFTEHQQIVGTPAYMSPEQSEMSGLDIDTRSDIYSLGVLLYELLTGVTPFDMRTLLKKGFAEMLRAIREDEPSKPSTRISTLGQTGTKTAQQRQVDAKKLSSLLRGDIDWIVMKCLEKDRNRRYETASGLAADIQRHLHDEPVTAGAPSAAYRLSKFVKRNRIQVLASGAVMAALLLGIVAFAWQAKEASDQRDQALQAKNSEAEQRKIAEQARITAEEQRAIAEAQRAEATKQAAEARKQEALAKEQEAEAKKQGAEAQRQATIAEAVATFQTAMLASVDPNQLPMDPVTKEPLKDALTVLQAMQGAIQVLDAGSLKDQPLVEAGVRYTIGNTLSELGRYDEAEPNLRKALAIRREVLEPGDLAIASSLNGLGTLLIAQGKLVEAEALHREALEIVRAAVPAGHPQIAYSLNLLALLLQYQNRLAEAEPLQREVLEINRAALPAGHYDISAALNNLAMLLQAQNKLVEAEALFRESLEILRGALPAGHPNIAKTLDNLAKLLQAQNQVAEAEPLMREALSIRRAAFPAGHREIALGLTNLGLILAAQNKPAEAESHFRESLAIFRGALPAKHESIANNLLSLASLLRDRRKTAEAERYGREALEILRAVRPAGDSRIADGLICLAEILEARGKHAESEPLYREALEMNRAGVLSGRTRDSVLNRVAALCWRQGKLDQSIPLFEEALALMEERLGRKHPDTLVTITNLGVNYKDAGRLAEAIPLLEEAYQGSKLEPNLALLGLPLLDGYAMMVDVAEPESLARIRTLVQALLADPRAGTAYSSSDLAGHLAMHGWRQLGLEKPGEAEVFLRESLAIYEKDQPDAWTTFHTRSLLGGALLGQQKLAEAEPLLLDGYRGVKEREASLPPEEKSRISETLERLVQLYEALGNATEAAAWRSKLEAAQALQKETAPGGDKK